MRLLAFLLLFLPVSAQVVECRGYGINRLEAVNDALRNAVEQGAGTKIFSETTVKNFVALKDILVSKSFGMVTQYRIVSTKVSKTGEWQVFIAAHVTKDIDRKWQKIKVVLKQKGYPTVMFLIQENLDQKKISSYGENLLMQKFKDLGFTVIDKNSVLKKLAEAKILYRLNREDLTKVLATKGVRLLITGTWEGQFNKRTKGPGQLYYLMHSYNLQTKVYLTDTHQVLAATNQSYTSTAEASLVDKYSAGKNGFVKALNDGYAQQIITDLLKAWIDENQQGIDIFVKIGNIKYRQGKKICEILKTIPQLTNVEVQEYHNGCLSIQIKSLWTIDTIADKLESIASFPLTVDSLSKNKIYLSYRESDQ